MRTCPVCAHPRRAEIEAALAKGEPWCDVAGRFGLPPDALLRHARNHPRPGSARTGSAAGKPEMPKSYFDHPMMSPEWTLIRVAIDRALEEFPEARQSLAAELRRVQETQGWNDETSDSHR